MLERVAIYSKDNNLKTREGVNRLVKEFCRRGIKNPDLSETGRSNNLP